jgi:hypothetical protein
MRDRTIKAQAEAKQQFDDYVRTTAGASGGGGGSTADELSKLASLKNAGTITEDEFQAQKAKLLG